MEYADYAHNGSKRSLVLAILLKCKLYWLSIHVECLDTIAQFSLGCIGVIRDTIRIYICRSDAFLGLQGILTLYLHYFIRNKI